MRRRSNGLVWLLCAGSIAIACASEEQGDLLTGNGGRGGKASGGAAGTATGGKPAWTGGSSGTAGGGSGGTPGGSSGSGGSASGGTSGTAGGGTGGTAGGVNNGDCTVGGAGFGENSLHAEFRAASVSATDYPGGTLHIVNDTASELAAADLDVRYYFTSEFACEDAGGHVAVVSDFRLQDPHAERTVSDVTPTVGVVGPNGAGCDVYFQFAFSATLAVGQYAQLSFWSKPPNDEYGGPASDQSNDYSFGACKTTAVPWDAIPVYVNDSLIWGSEPEEGVGGQGGAGGSGGAAGAPSAGAGGA